MKAPRSVIFDCDPGHDDAIALVLALADRRLDVRAVTTVFGNASVENTTRNAQMVLELCGRGDIPVAVGAAASILGESHFDERIHGSTGMDGHSLPQPQTRPVKQSAVELMERIVRESKVPVTIVATGTLTNVAVFLLACPDLFDKIDCISIMGGGCEEGNRTAVAEANIWKDPEAAHIVLNSGIPIELYGLNVTHRALILTGEFEKFRAGKSRVTRFVGDLLDYFAKFYTGVGSLAGCPMHDPCAVAGLLEPRLFDFEYMKMGVDLFGSVTRGAIDFDLRTEPRRDRPYTGKAAVDVDREGFVQLIFDACESFAETEVG